MGTTEEATEHLGLVIVRIESYELRLFRKHPCPGGRGESAPPKTNA